MDQPKHSPASSRLLSRFSFIFNHHKQRYRNMLHHTRKNPGDFHDQRPTIHTTHWDAETGHLLFSSKRDAETRIPCLTVHPRQSSGLLTKLLGISFSHECCDGPRNTNDLSRYFKYLLFFSECKRYHDLKYHGKLCMYAYMCVCGCVCMYVCMCVCIYI